MSNSLVIQNEFRNNDITNQLSSKLASQTQETGSHHPTDYQDNNNNTLKSINSVKDSVKIVVSQCLDSEAAPAIMNPS